MGQLWPRSPVTHLRPCLAPEGEFSIWARKFCVTAVILLICIHTQKEAFELGYASARLRSTDRDRKWQLRRGITLWYYVISQHSGEGESNVNSGKISDPGVDMSHEKQQMCRCLATCCFVCVDLRWHVSGSSAWPQNFWINLLKGW